MFNIFSGDASSKWKEARLSPSICRKKVMLIRKCYGIRYVPWTTEYDYILLLNSAASLITIMPIILTDI